MNRERRKREAQTTNAVGSNHGDARTHEGEPLVKVKALVEMLTKKIREKKNGEARTIGCNFFEPWRFLNTRRRTKGRMKKGMMER